jgi:hypothetical protein
LTSGASTGGPPPALKLVAGRWSAVLDGAVVHSVRAGDTEVAQRVYVAVRDAAWNTIPGEVRDSVVLSRRPEVVEVALDVRHRLGPIDLTWHGTVSLHEANGFGFTFAGRAETSFSFAKVGLNVHHPLETTLGRRLRAHTPAGWVEHRVPTEISPQRFEDGRFSAMFPEYDALEVEIRPGSWASFRFTGDLWEMQDHRNWTDANLKSYLTLATPAPARILAGEEIRQSLRAAVDPELLVERRRLAPRGVDGVVITDAPAPATPEIGVELDDGTLVPDAFSPADLGAFKPAYLRVPLHLSRGSLEEDLARAVLWLSALQAPAELAIFVPNDTSALDGLDRALRRRGMRVIRFAVFDEGAELDGRSGSTRPDTYTAARRALTFLADVPGGVGTERFFAELNRQPPSSPDASFVTFTINPQVHVGDDRALMENVEVQKTVVAEARRVSGGLPVVVGNVALVGRHGPFPDGPGRGGGGPASADPRIGHPIVAAWTLASIRAIADGGATAASWFEVGGDRGILGPPPRPPLPTLMAAARCATRSRSAVASPRDVAALAFRAGDHLDVLLANLTPDEREVPVGRLPVTVRARPLGSSPDEERVLASRRGRAAVPLGPFETVWLRASTRSR